MQSSGSHYVISSGGEKAIFNILQDKYVIGTNRHGKEMRYILRQYRNAITGYQYLMVYLKVCL